jgi:hypothetical protein
LLLTAANIQDGKAGSNTVAGSDLLERLTNYSTLVAAAALRPLLLELHLLIKSLQVEDVYIVDLMDTVASTIVKIESLYDSLAGFSGTDFVTFLRLTSTSNPKCPLVETADVDGSIIVAYKVQSSDGEELEQFTMYAEMPKAGLSGRSACSRVFNFAQVPQIVNHVKEQVEKCAKAEVQQLRSHMGESDLLRSLGVVFPQTFDKFDLMPLQPWLTHSPITLVQASWDLSL